MNTPMRLLLAGLALGTASLAFGGPGPQYWEQMRRAQTQATPTKTGDKTVYVCNQCKAAAENMPGMAMPAQAMERCKVGDTVTCPACKTKVKITTFGPPKNQITRRDVVYVNDKGEECVFVAQTSGKP